MGCVLCPAALGVCSVLQPPPCPQISPQLSAQAWPQQLFIDNMEGAAPITGYFHSFLIDMFFSLSFCITWGGRRQGWVQHSVPKLSVNYLKITPKPPQDQVSGLH